MCNTDARTTDFEPLDRLMVEIAKSIDLSKELSLSPDPREGRWGITIHTWPIDNSSSGRLQNTIRSEKIGLISDRVALEALAKEEIAKVISDAKAQMVSMGMDAILRARLYWRNICNKQENPLGSNGCFWLFIEGEGKSPKTEP